MNPRSQATIDIKRNGQLEPVASVLITERSVRRFMLMQEDYIQLEFSLATAVHFSIGDYIDDIFGRFVITEEQMPKVNNTTGGYDYSLRFDKDYMAGKQWLYCLVSNGLRMETCWSLTDRLSVHAQQVADNYNISAHPTITTIQDPLGENRYISTGYAISMGNEARFAEVKFLSYDGVNLIEAMQMIADAWECEWWVTDEDTIVGDTTYKHTIHFGKCEDAGDAYDFRLGDNVESMEVNRDQQTYANRIFGYGGKQNIPESYDRLLVLTVTHVFASGNNSEFYDANRLFRVDMVNGAVTNQQTALQQPAQPAALSGVKTMVSATPVARDSYTLSGQITTVLTWDWGQSSHPANTPIVGVDIYINGQLIAVDDTPTPASPVIRTLGGESSSSQNMQSTWTCQFQFAGLPIGDTDEITLEIRWTASFGTCTASTTSFSVNAVGTTATASKQIKVNIGGSLVDATFNSNFSDGTSIPARFKVAQSVAVGDVITIPEEYIELVNIPYSFFTLDYSVGTLNLLGERRLHLPLADYPNRYAGENISQSRVVELLVCFEKIFPRLSLVVTDVTTEIKTGEIEHEDGSIERQQWVQYKFTATKAGGEEFIFNTRYIMDGNKLQGVFTAPAEISGNGHRLSGMTFDLGFDNGTQVYTIVRNEDYGVKLPNDLLYPKAGDTFFLTGWNPKALPELGLVDDAEQELAEAVENYLAAIQDGQFTFTCRMMSKWGFDLCAHRFYSNNEEGDTNTGNDEPFFVNNAEGDIDPTNDLALYVSNGYTEYALLEAGAKVKVWHDALPSGFKVSRVIGYEFKLDMPFDTPTYTIGETDAYSRLKKIEKELTKL